MIIVRALWGSQDYIINEIPKVPVFGNLEIVYVWGQSNYDYLKSLNYNCILVNIYETESTFSNYLTHYNHKLKAFKLAGERYGEYLFLDWDMHIVKPLDAEFWKLVRSKPLQAPLYSYPIGYYEMIDEASKKEVDGWSSTLQTWIKTQMKELSKYHYNLENTQVTPNAGFFYDSTGKVGADLLKISLEYNLETCIEEYAMFIYSNCKTMDEYIEKHEPFVVYGRPDWSTHFKLNKVNSQIIINNYLNTKITKSIYLEHR